MTALPTPPQPLVSLTHWGAFEAEVAGDRLVGARPWPGSGADPRMIGALPDLVHSPTRIDRPHVREGYLRRRDGADRTGRGRDRMVPVDWDGALDLVAEALARTYGEAGPEAVFGGSYGWSSAGRFHHARTQVRRFLSATGGFVDQIGNYSWGAAQGLLPYVLGDFDTVSSAATDWSTLIGTTDLLVAFGGLNPKNWRVTSGGAGRHAMGDWVRRAAAAGTAITIVSPLRDDCPAGIPATWIAPRPNTDTAILLALTREVIQRGRADWAFLDRYTVGTDALVAYLDGRTDGVPKTLAWAAAIADVPVAGLDRLADRLCRARRVMLTAAWSLQRADHGEQPFWATIALAAVLGQIGLPGGGFCFGYGSMNGIGQAARRGYVPAMDGLPNPIAGAAIPVARVIDMLERPGTDIPFHGRRVRLPDCRLIYWAGGNPFHHLQDLNRAARAWTKPETVIVHEPWWTPTARRADIVLPATTAAERNDIGGNSRDPFVFPMPRLIPPVGQARDDWAIFADIADRLGCADHFTAGRDEAGWLRHLWAKTHAKARADGVAAPDFEAFWAGGPWPVPLPERPQILLDSFRADPDAVRLTTPSGRIEIASDRIAGFGYADCPGHPAWLEPKEWLGAPDRPEGALHLITHQPPTRLHSQLAQTPAGRTDHPTGLEPLRLNPADAAARRIADGAVVTVENARGRCLAGAVVTDAVRPGVAVMATGAWWTPDPDDPACDRGGNPNVLTRDAGTSSLTQACAAQSALVLVRPVERPETHKGWADEADAVAAPTL